MVLDNLYNRYHKFHRSWFTGQPRWPLCVQFETTNACNLRCTMCPTTHYPTSKKTVDEPLVQAVLDAVPHIVALRPYLNGEPLVYNGLFSLMQRARERNPNIDLAFNTNAMLLDADARRQILRLPMNHIVVSMDGACAPTYNAIRIGADFDTVVDNLTRLMREKESTPGAITTASLQMTVHKDNVHEMPDLVRLAAKIGVQCVMFNNLEPYCESQAGLICYGNPPSEEYTRIFAETQALAEKHGLSCTAGLLNADGVTRYCPGLRITYITVDGNVHPCGQLMSNDAFWYLGEKRCHHGPVTFGSLYEQSLYDIWNSRDYRAFRKNLIRHKFHPECKQCLISQSVVCNTLPYVLEY